METITTRKSSFANKLIIIASIAIVMATMFFAMSASAEELATPAKVANLKQTKANSSSSVDIAWDAQLQNGVQYAIELSTDNVTWTQKDTAYSASKYIYGLNTGTMYYARVRAYVTPSYPNQNNLLYGPYSDTITVVTQPANLSTDIIQTGATADSVTVSWGLAPGANLYNVYYYQGTSATPVLAGQTNVASFTIGGLAQDQSYSIKVAPVLSNGIFSAVGSEKTLYNDAVTIPVQITSPNHDWLQYIKEIRLSWDSSLNADGYEIVVYGSNGKKITTLETTSTSSYFKNAAKNTFYTYKIRGYINVNGARVYGAYSNEAYAIYSPQVEIKRLSKSSQKISWHKVKGATSYTIYRSQSEKSGYKKMATIKASKKITNYTFKKLKSKNIYYYFVKVNKKVGGKTYKSLSTTCYYLRY